MNDDLDMHISLAPINLMSIKGEMIVLPCPFNQLATSAHARRQIADLVQEALTSLFPEESGNEPLVAACTNKFGDYQWYIYFLVLEFCGILVM